MFKKQWIICSGWALFIYLSSLFLSLLPATLLSLSYFDYKLNVNHAYSALIVIHIKIKICNASNKQRKKNGEILQKIFFLNIYFLYIIRSNRSNELFPRRSKTKLITTKPASWEIKEKVRTENKLFSCQTNSFEFWQQ